MAEWRQAEVCGITDLYPINGEDKFESQMGGVQKENKHIYVCVYNS